MVPSDCNKDDWLCWWEGVSLTLRIPSEIDGIVKPLDKVESRNYPPKWGRYDKTSGDRQGSKHDAIDDDTDISTPETERNHVHAVYDAIATQWHHTRDKRGAATQFLKQLPKGSILAVVISEARSYVSGRPSRCYRLRSVSEPLLQTSIGACSQQTNFFTRTCSVDSKYFHFHKLRIQLPIISVMKWSCLLLVHHVFRGLLILLHIIFPYVINPSIPCIGSRRVYFCIFFNVHVGNLIRLFCLLAFG